MSDLNEWLKERRDVLNSDRDLVAEDMAVRQFPALLTAVEKVLELHTPTEDMDGDYLCSVCAETANCTVAMYWPCPTVRAVQSAIEGASNE